MSIDHRYTMEDGIDHFGNINNVNSENDIFENTRLHDAMVRYNVSDEEELNAQVTYDVMENSINRNNVDLSNMIEIYINNCVMEVSVDVRTGTLYFAFCDQYSDPFDILDVEEKLEILDANGMFIDMTNTRFECWLLSIPRNNILENDEEMRLSSGTFNHGDILETKIKEALFDIYPKIMQQYFTDD